MTGFDFRDAVEQGCDAFAPERREAIPLGRGATFVEFLDINRAKVRVVLSSAAMRECCRVLIEPHDVDRVQIVTPSGIVHPAKADADLHLCRCMASALWWALNEAYGNTLDTQPYCESSGRIGPEATAVLHNDLTAERDRAYEAMDEAERNLSTALGGADGNMPQLVGLVASLTAEWDRLREEVTALKKELGWADEQSQRSFAQRQQIEAERDRLREELQGTKTNLEEAEAVIVRASESLTSEHPAFWILDDYDGSCDSIKALVAERDRAMKVVEAAQEFPTDLFESLVADKIHSASRAGDERKRAYYEAKFDEIKTFEELLDTYRAKTKEGQPDA